MSPDIWSAIAAGASAVAAIVALFITLRQTTEAKRARDVAVLLPLYQSHQSNDSVEARSIIRGERGDLGLEAVDASLLRTYINGLNFLSSLIIGYLVDEDQAKVVFQNAILVCWDNCKEAIIPEIRTGKPAFAAELETVANAWNAGKRIQRRRLGKHRGAVEIIRSGQQ
jgi:hypothetical protein